MEQAPATSQSSPMKEDYDLTRPEFHPMDCPAWLGESFPEWIAPYRGINGMPPEWRARLRGINAESTAGVDRYQSNQFIAYRPETADYLENEYTSLQVDYVKGMLPEIEVLASEATIGSTSNEEKAGKFLEVISERLKHPYIPPFSPVLRSDRNLDEAGLIESGAAWCNEQARVFVRLCQTQQIPARIIHLFYSTPPLGHTIAEFHNGKQWCLVDASYCIIFKDVAGNALSAAQCHDRGSGQRRFGELFHRHLEALVSMYRAALEISTDSRAIPWLRSRARVTAESCADELDWFGVINYRLPQSVNC